MDIAFILRGMQGLGHVLPGYNIANELKFRKTYGGIYP
jgi:hypothetical protein